MLVIHIIFSHHHGIKHCSYDFFLLHMATTFPIFPCTIRQTADHLVCCSVHSHVLVYIFLLCRSHTFAAYSYQRGIRPTINFIISTYFVKVYSLVHQWLIRLAVYPYCLLNFSRTNFLISVCSLHFPLKISTSSYYFNQS